MALIDYTAFEAQPLFIAGINNDWVQEIVTDTITYYEPIVLREVLGEELYEEFNPEDSTWDDLKALLTDISKRYCYYWYHRNNSTSTVEIGEVGNSDTNIKQASPSQKMTVAINELAYYADKVFDLVQDDTTGLYDNYSPEIVDWRINEFGF